ncbi:MAG: 4Fe-4S dicluster domain-containing protein [Pseudomonadota bacterium]
MMKKWNLIIDVEHSVHAINAVLAAKDEYVGNDHPGYSAPLDEDNCDIMTVERHVRGETPLVDSANLLKTCNHCDDAPCVKLGGDAVTKRDDGITIIDPVKAKGRRDIYESCPHNAIVWNETLELPQIWTFDAHLLDQGWTKPRCVQSCATGAIEAVKISDEEMQAKVQEENLEVLRPDLKTQPRVYYKNLYRVNKCFIGGSVLTKINGVEECLEGADVKIYQGNELVGSAVSDDFGEFKVDYLEPESGAYRVEISHPDFGSNAVDVELVDSLYLGIITL